MPTFRDFIDTVQDFYGVDGFKFKIGNYIFEAKEDDNDGYRSGLGDVVEVTSGTFSSQPLAKVKIEEVNSRIAINHFNMDSGFVLMDVNTHQILVAFGTDNEDDYYPCYVFEALLAPSFQERIPENNMTTQDLVGRLVFCRSVNYFYIGILNNIDPKHPMGVTLLPSRIVFHINDRSGKRVFEDMGGIVKSTPVIIFAESVEEINGTIEKPVFKE
jgi:hypothetical protein